MKKYVLFLFILAAVFCFTAQAMATPFSLWIGNDTTASYPILNTDTAGNVLRTGPNVGSSGIAIDSANDTIFVGDGTFTGSPITALNLTTLAPTGTSFDTPNVIDFGEDMAFDGTNIWRAGFNGIIAQINPITGDLISSFDSGFDNAMGIAWDGSALWVSPFNGDAITRFTTTGTLTGEVFNTGLTYGGGLAYDPRDGTLYIGQFGEIYHYNTSGGLLGSFGVGDARFIDSLEMELGTAPVPEPATMLLLGTGLVGVAGAARRKKKNQA